MKLIRLISLFVFCFLLTTISVFVSTECSASQITVDNTKIQDAINASVDGDVILVKEGVYKERIVINKNISLVGMGNIKLVGDGTHKPWENYTGIYVSNSSASIYNVTIGGFVIGVRFHSSSHNTIKSCTFTNNCYGVFVKNSTDVLIIDNTFENNTYGIYGYSSNFVRVVNNTLVKNSNAIIVESSSNNMEIRDNVLTGNTNATMIYTSQNSTLSGNKISNSIYAVYLGSSSGANLTKNSITNNTNGVMLKASPNVTLSYNNIVDNTQYGLSSDLNISADNNYWGDKVPKINGTNVSSVLQTKLNLFPPKIGSFSPSVDFLTLNETQSLLFKVSASDLDGDELHYRWDIDEIPTSDTGSAIEYHVTVSSTEIHKIMVIVSDSNLSDSVSWEIIVYNVNVRPKAFIDSVSTNDNRTFTLIGHGTDVDGSIAECVWWYSGGELGKNSTINVSLSEGRHTIFFKVQDNDGSWSENASVNVSAAGSGGEWEIDNIYVWVCGVLMVAAVSTIVWAVKYR